jgi:Adenylate and Guanylate cyclase catalytic domain
LSIRVGIHSGAVVAGVILAERPRFQLFGDAVNIASRMESTSLPGHIQISEETASLLAGVARFALSRRGTVEVKGKGRVVTFWLAQRTLGRMSSGGRALLLPCICPPSPDGDGDGDGDEASLNRMLDGGQVMEADLPTLAAAAAANTPPASGSWRQIDVSQL